MEFVVSVPKSKLKSVSDVIVKRKVISLKVTVKELPDSEVIELEIANKTSSISYEPSGTVAE